MKKQCAGTTESTTKVRGWHKFHACQNEATITGPDGREWCPVHAKKAGLYVKPSKTLFKVHFVVVSAPEGSHDTVGEVGVRSVAAKSEQGARAGFLKVEKQYSGGVEREITKIEQDA